jgi:hypothetical protein
MSNVMLLMTIRHKPIQLFTWLLCFLTFYLGFNHQVMCYELIPQGGIHKIHLQFIECNPLASSAVPTKHSPYPDMPLTLFEQQTANVCPACRDFHISFKKSPGFDSLSIGPMVSYLFVNPPILFPAFLASLNAREARYPLDSHAYLIQLNPTLASLKATVLLI